uniref:Uncharacterized protein n=1 Tax=Clastoptera arizonana TaxID=38151 RepID=A0A1B6D214_9HEMI
MKLQVLALISITVCLGRPPVDETPLLEYLDKKITAQLYDPTEGQGDKLIKNLKTYNERLGEVIDMIDQDVLDAFVKSKSLLKAHGGPEFLQCHFDRGLSRWVYKWTDDQVDSLSADLKNTKKLWSRIVEMLPAAEKKFENILTEEKKAQQNIFGREKQRIKDFHKEWDEFEARRKSEREQELKAGVKDVSGDSVDSSDNYDSSLTRSASSNIPPEFEAKSTLSSLEKE